MNSHCPPPTFSPYRILCHKRCILNWALTVEWRMSPQARCLLPRYWRSVIVHVPPKTPVLVLRDCLLATAIKMNGMWMRGSPGRPKRCVVPRGGRHRGGCARRRSFPGRLSMLEPELGRGPPGVGAAPRSAAGRACGRGGRRRGLHHGGHQAGGAAAGCGGSWGRRARARARRRDGGEGAGERAAACSAGLRRPSSPSRVGAGARSGRRGSCAAWTRDGGWRSAAGSCWAPAVQPPAAPEVLVRRSAA